MPSGSTARRGAAVAQRSLTPLETALWIAQESDPADVSTHIHRAIWLGTRIDAEAAKYRLDQLARRQPVLRRSFQAAGAAAACLLLQPGALTSWLHVHNAAGWADEVIEQCVRRRFDLAVPPLVRVHILTSCTHDGTVLVFVAHHLLVDGSSFDQLTSELLGALVADDGRTPPPQPPMPPNLKCSPADPQTWRNMLEPLPEHNVSLRPYRSLADAHSDLCTVQQLPADFMGAVHQVRQQIGCGTVSILLGIYCAALLRVLDMPDLLMMTQVDARTRAERNIMGMMINTIPVRSALREEGTWSDFLSQTHDSSVTALRHRNVPFQDILAIVRPERRADRSSIFTDFEFTAVREWEIPAEIRQRGIRARAIVRPDPATRYGLSINVAMSAESGHVRWAAKSGYYDPADLELVQQAAGLLAADMRKDVLRRPARADLLPARELATVRALGTGSRRPIPVDGWLTRLSRHCARIPESPAIRHASMTVSYAQLGRMISGIGRELTASGITAGDRVATCVTRGPEHICSIFAILSVGAAYVPIDLANPPARIAEMLRITAPKLVLASGKPDLGGASVRVVDIGDGLSDWSADGSLVLGPDERSRGPADPAYVLFTSGSTGVPKGVEVGMRAFVNHLLMMEETLGLDSGHVVAQTAPLAFDVHVWQCVAALMAVGSVAVYDETLLLEPLEFVRQAARDRVTVLELVPSYLSAILTAHAGHGRPQDLRELPLRYLISTGEALSGDLANSLLDAFGSATLLNAYGPAEAADDVTLAPVRRQHATDVVPIGWPERNVEMLVIDRFGRARPPGLIGQLAIGGQVLANGYVNDPDSPTFVPDPYNSRARIYLTGDRCVLDPSAGFVHLGRSDAQVKVGGRRVELGEVDAALASVPGVLMAATILRNAAGRSHLLAKVVLAPGTALAEVRRQALALLPAYMVPTVIEHASELPLGATGKVDRKRLAAQEVGASPDLSGPDDELAAIVRAAWVSVLPPDPAITSPFFAAGGDSLRAMDLVIRLQAKGIPAAIGQIYQYQDLDAFVESIRQSAATDRGPEGVIPDILPTPRQEEMLESVHDGAPVPVQAVILRSKVPAGDLLDAVHLLVARHPELRIGFDRDRHGQHSMRVRSAGDPAVYPELARLPDGPWPAGDEDGALVELAAGQLDQRRGRHAGLAIRSSGDACLVVSHLVCDLVSLRTVVLELDDLLTPGAAGRLADRPASSFLPWASLIAQRRLAGPGQADARFRSAVRVASERSLSGWHRTSRLASGRAPAGVSRPTTVRIAERWPAGLADDALPLVAVAAVALAERRVTGTTLVRVDLDLDGRRAFESVGISGAGVGCFTLVSPVLLDLADGTGRDLIAHVRLALASRAHDAAWDCSKPVADESEPVASTVPLVNVVGGSLRIGGLATLSSCTVPTVVPARNALSDPHAVTVDVSLPRAAHQPGRSVEFLVTPGPASEVGLGDRFIAAMRLAAGEVLGLAAAQVPGLRPAPDGLDLLDLSPAEVGELLIAVADADPVALPAVPQVRDLDDC